MNDTQYCIREINVANVFITAEIAHAILPIAIIVLQHLEQQRRHVPPIPDFAS